MIVNERWGEKVRRRWRVMLKIQIMLKRRTKRKTKSYVVNKKVPV